MILKIISSLNILLLKNIIAKQLLTDKTKSIFKNKYQENDLDQHKETKEPLQDEKGPITKRKSNNTKIFVFGGIFVVLWIIAGSKLSSLLARQSGKSTSSNKQKSSQPLSSNPQPHQPTPKNPIPPSNHTLMQNINKELDNIQQELKEINVIQEEDNLDTSIAKAKYEQCLPLLDKFISILTADIPFSSLEEANIIINNIFILIANTFCTLEMFTKFSHNDNIINKDTELHKLSNDLIINTVDIFINEIINEIKLQNYQDKDKIRITEKILIFRYYDGIINENMNFSKDQQKKIANINDKFNKGIKKD